MQGSSYQRVFEIHEPPVIHRKPPLLEALSVLTQSKTDSTFVERRETNAHFCHLS